VTKLETSIIFKRKPGPINSKENPLPQNFKITFVLIVLSLNVKIVTLLNNLT